MQDEARDQPQILPLDAAAEEKKLEITPVSPEHYPTNWGSSYLVEEKSKLASIDMFKAALAKGGNGLFISGIFPKQLRAQYGFKDIRFMWVSDTAAGVKAFNPRRLEFEISASVSKFIKATKNSVVFLDNLELLVLTNTFPKVIDFLKFVIDLAAVNEGVFIVPVDPSVVGAKELAILEKTMNVVLVPEKEIKERQNAELEFKRNEEERRKLEFEVNARAEQRKISELKLKKIEEERLKIEAEHRAIASERVRAELEFKRLEEERAKQEALMRIREEERKRAEIALRTHEEERKKLEMELRMMDEQKRKLELEQNRLKEQKKIEKLRRKVSHGGGFWGRYPHAPQQQPVPLQVQPQVMCQPSQQPSVPLAQWLAQIERKEIPICDVCIEQIKEPINAIRCGCGRYYHELCSVKTHDYKCACGSELTPLIRAGIEKLRAELKSAAEIWASVGVHSDELVSANNEIQSLLAFDIGKAIDFAVKAAAQLPRISTELSPKFSAEFLIRTPFVPGQWCDEELVITNIGRSGACNIAIAIESKEAEMIIGIDSLPQLRETQSVRIPVKIRSLVQQGDINIVVRLTAHRVVDNKARSFTITKSLPFHAQNCEAILCAGLRNYVG